jgi:hypothetical protein
MDATRAGTENQDSETARETQRARDGRGRRGEGRDDEGNDDDEGEGQGVRRGEGQQGQEG